MSPSVKPMSVKPIRAAVVGVGHFGRYHADKYARLAGTELVAVVDIDLARARSVGDELGVEAFADISEILDRVDAVSVATPATSHFSIAGAFLQRGIHVLVEKPMATSLEDADALIALARQSGAILQVGHQERFFAELLGLTRAEVEPREIVYRRSGPFTGRGMDCNVVLDLMIHDIDMMHQMIGSPLESLTAFGGAVHGGLEDEAQVTIETRGGCRVRLHASRVSDRSERTLEVRSASGTLSVDFLRRIVRRRAKAAKVNGTKVNGAKVNGAKVNGTKVESGPAATLAARDLLATEISAFVESIRTGKAPLVNGKDGRRALETALLISRHLRPWPALDDARVQAR